MSVRLMPQLPGCLAYALSLLRCLGQGFDCDCLAQGNGVSQSSVSPSGVGQAALQAALVGCEVRAALHPSFCVLCSWRHLLHWPPV